eukprot:11490188-Alexandrium_andersonii.AAC.1
MRPKAVPARGPGVVPPPPPPPPAAPQLGVAGAPAQPVVLNAALNAFSGLAQAVQWDVGGQPRDQPLGSVRSR